MRTKNLLVAFFILIWAGCEDDPKYEIYENHDITVCGIKDPIRNIDWVAEICNRKEFALYESIRVYKNKETEEIYLRYSYQFFVGVSRESWTKIYTCSGEVIMEGSRIGPSGPPYDFWRDFESQNELIGTIWTVEKIKIQQPE